MGHFAWTLRVQLSFYAVILVAPSTPEAPHLSDNNLIGNFLQKFIKPFLRAANSTPIVGSNTTSKQETKVVAAIEKKIAKLRPLLQDDDEKVETEDNLTLRGNGETTVVEFLPQTMRKHKDEIARTVMRTVFKPDPLKTSINKYKLLREQIKITLDKEEISRETKTLIINTLDEMIAQLIESQCTWNPHMVDKRLIKGGKDTHDSMKRLQAMTKKQWKHLRQQYLDYLSNMQDKENAFMNEFHQFFSGVINETQNLSDRYKIRCQLVQMQNGEKSPQDKLLLRGQNEIKDECEKFILCSDELREFLIDFYNYVNDTAVSTFTNYAAMYVRDVNIDFGVDSSVVVKTINDLGTSAVSKVSKTFRKELKKFSLDPNKVKSENIKHIKDFIEAVVAQVKTVGKEIMVRELGAKKTKLFLTVKEDLVVNLEVDMENLGRHYIDTICTMFQLCNSRYSTRRQEGPWTFRPRANSEVFVKVQLSLDDEMKDAVVQSGLLQMMENPRHVKMRFSRNNRGRERSVVVTRTTIDEDVTKAHKHNKKHHHAHENTVSYSPTRIISDNVEENEVIIT